MTVKRQEDTPDDSTRKAVSVVTADVAPHEVLIRDEALREKPLSCQVLQVSGVSEVPSASEVSGMQLKGDHE